MGRPRRPPEEWKHRFEAHLHRRDIEILDWLTEKEGGKRNTAMIRAFELFATHVEALGKELKP